MIEYNSNYPYRVLVVDDDGSQRALQSEILSPPRYLVTEARDGAEALALIPGGGFDVVLLDKRMPGIDGDEVCRRIRRDLDEAMLPIIMVTGKGTSDELAGSLQAGANDFIRKPYSPLELMARVDAAANQKRMIDQLDNAEAMLFALARMVEAKDQNTGDHCSRLAHKGVVFGQALGLGGEDLRALRRGGVLHDIGKLGIPEAVLLKPGHLDDDEWTIMRRHPVIGERLCSGLRSMRSTLPIIRSHHERWDGSGYPDGLRGEAIPLLARVFQIVDIHDALTFARPYKRALEPGEAVAILERETACGWRDPELMRVFLDIVRNRPGDLEAPEPIGKEAGAGIFEPVVAGNVPA